MSEPTATEQPPVIRNSDMLALKRYITSRDHNPRHGLGDTTLLIDLTHSNLVQKHIEIRFDKHDRLSDVRNKIHQKTGTAPHFQALVLKCSGQVLLELPADDESYDHHKLGYFFGDDLCLGLEVHCIDTNPLSGSSNGQYEDTSLVEKYRMTEEDYNQRKGTLRDWSRVQLEKDKNFTLARHAREHRERSEAIRQFKLGIFPLPYGYVVDSTGMDIVRGDEPDYDDIVALNQQQQQQRNKKKQQQQCCQESNNNNNAALSGVDESSVAGITLGDRCLVQPGSRRGTVSYKGKVPELDDDTNVNANDDAGDSCSYWVGVTFDEPVGKTDGSATHRRTGAKKHYFEAPQNYASFVRGKNVEVGDFPELDLFGSDDDDDSINDGEDEL